LSVRPTFKTILGEKTIAEYQQLSELIFLKSVTWLFSSTSNLAEVYKVLPLWVQKFICLSVCAELLTEW